MSSEILSGPMRVFFSEVLKQIDVHRSGTTGGVGCVTPPKKSKKGAQRAQRRPRNAGIADRQHFPEIFLLSGKILFWEGLERKEGGRKERGPNFLIHHPPPTNTAEKRLRMHQIMKIWRGI